MNSDYPLRVLVCGGRDYTDWVTFSDSLAEISIAEICHGGAQGADSLAADYGALEGIPTRVYRADWRRQGRAAGVLRNRLMLADFQPDLVVAFPGGKGTAHMVSIARAGGFEVLEVPVTGYRDSTGGQR